MKSIKNKILTVVIAGLFVITAIVSAIAVTMTHEIMHKDADRILKNATQKEAAYINDALGDIKKSAAIMEHYAADSIEGVDQLKDPEFLADYLGKNKSMFTEIALNTTGVEGYFMRLNPEYTNSTTGFYNIVNEDLTITEMPVTDLSKYPENDTKNVGWYYAPIEAGKGVWLDPYYFPGYNVQMISYTIPVYVNSKLLGVVGFDMDFSYLVDRISTISVYDNGYAVLLAKDGVTPYNDMKVEQTNDPHTKSTVALSNGMFLEIRADYKDIQKEIHPMLSNIVIAFVCVMIAAIIYTVVVTHRIVRPLRQLTAAAEEISIGSTDSKLSRIATNSKDEVGVLANVLNNTYEKIQEYTTYINALAYRDSLTGIKNSTAYTEAIAKLNKEINLNNPRFGLVIADINNLKLTNDKYGHDVGNDLIVHTARILMNTFKNSAVFRIGGDEFAVLLQGDDYANYHALLDKLDESCARDYISVFEEKIPVTLARGVALYDPEIDTVYEDVFAKADHAMYMHKHESKMARA